MNFVLWQLFIEPAIVSERSLHPADLQRAITAYTNCREGPLELLATNVSSKIPLARQFPRQGVFLQHFEHAVHVLRQPRMKKLEQGVVLATIEY